MERTETSKKRWCEVVKKNRIEAQEISMRLESRGISYSTGHRGRTYQMCGTVNFKRPSNKGPVAWRNVTKSVHMSNANLA